jgi:hypothetical protein
MCLRLALPNIDRMRMMIRDLALGKCLTGPFEKRESEHFRGFTTQRMPAITF